MRQPATQQAASAEAVFGSTARGDTDAMSDRDILIVDDSLEVLRTRARVLEADGWSVASYTYAKLNALARRGALFIQHLKLESSILVDQDGRLGEVLAAFRPRADYSAEIRDNAKLASLIAAVPEGGRGTLLAADIMYVSVRNFGVLSLAERGIHAYAFDVVASALEAEQLIGPGGARSIAALRFLKCLYRAGEVERGQSAYKAVKDALAVLPPRHFPAKFGTVPCQEIIAAPSLVEPASPYLVLRDLERRLLALKEMGNADGADADLARLSHWIANPRAYAGVANGLAPKLRASMMKHVHGFFPSRRSLDKPRQRRCLLT